MLLGRGDNFESVVPIVGRGENFGVSSSSLLLLQRSTTEAFLYAAAFVAAETVLSGTLVLREGVEGESFWNRLSFLGETLVEAEENTLRCVRARAAITPAGPIVPSFVWNDRVDSFPSDDDDEHEDFRLVGIIRLFQAKYVAAAAAGFGFDGDDGLGVLPFALLAFVVSSREMPNLISRARARNANADFDGDAGGDILCWDAIVKKGRKSMNQ